MHKYVFLFSESFLELPRYPSLIFPSFFRALDSTLPFDINQYQQQSKTHLGYEYTTTEIAPQTISLVPILRSGLGMLEAVQSLLPNPVPVHHLGLFREPTTLQPVEYYNNLPYHRPSTAESSSGVNSSASDLAILGMLLFPPTLFGPTCQGES